MIRRLFTPQALNATGHNLVENVVGSLQSLLRDDTGLLQQVCNNDCSEKMIRFAVFSKSIWSTKTLLTGFNVSSGQFSRVTEMDTDEFTLKYGIENMRLLLNPPKSFQVLNIYSLLYSISKKLLKISFRVGSSFSCFQFVNWMKKIFDELTKREELSLRVVLALPKASSTGLVCTIWSSKLPWEKRKLHRVRKAHKFAFWSRNGHGQTQS